MIVHEGEMAPLTSQMLARANFLAVCLTIFLFDFRPRIFAIGLHGKKSIRSGLMICECSNCFPLGFIAESKLIKIGANERQNL